MKFEMEPIVLLIEIRLLCFVIPEIFACGAFLWFWLEIFMRHLDNEAQISVEMYRFLFLDSNKVRFREGTRRFVPIGSTNFEKVSRFELRLPCTALKMASIACLHHINSS